MCAVSSLGSMWYQSARCAKKVSPQISVLRAWFKTMLPSLPLLLLTSSTADRIVVPPPTHLLRHQGTTHSCTKTMCVLVSPPSAIEDKPRLFTLCLTVCPLRSTNLLLTMWPASSTWIVTYWVRNESAAWPLVRLWGRNLLTMLVSFRILSLILLLLARLSTQTVSMRVFHKPTTHQWWTNLLPPFNITKCPPMMLM